MALKSFRTTHAQMRAGVLLIGILLAQLVGGCASRDTYIPFSIPREEFQWNARTIALVPVLGPQGIALPDSLLAEVDALIEETLHGAGYACVTAAEYAAAWDRIVSQMGGLYDSITGEIDDLRLEVAKEQLRLDLVEMHQPDYMVFPEIWVVQAASSRGVATWDGTSQPIVGFGMRLLNALDAALHQYDGFLQPEVVDALSLGVVVEDMQGAEIFQNAGGIEVLKVVDEPDTFAPVLSDHERNVHAVRTALLPFLDGRIDIPPVR